VEERSSLIDRYQEYSGLRECVLHVEECTVSLLSLIVSGHVVICGNEACMHRDQSCSSLTDSYWASCALWE
jgi:hypothetical protein